MHRKQRCIGIVIDTRNHAPCNLCSQALCMLLKTLAEFGAWAESEGLQVIGTRVATDDTCSVIIEDGRVAEGAGQLKAEMPEIKVEIPDVKIPEVKIPATMQFGGSF